jgi:hypothetical protein
MEHLRHILSSLLNIQCKKKHFEETKNFEETMLSR